MSSQNDQSERPAGRIGGQEINLSDSTIVSPDKLAGNDTAEEELTWGIPYWIASVRNWEKWWYRKSHPLCSRCRLDCKQSWRVKIIRCPQFEAKDGK